MAQKVVRLMTGTDDMSVRCVVSVMFDDQVATERDMIDVLSQALVHAAHRFTNGPYEEGTDG